MAMFRILLSLKYDAKLQLLLDGVILDVLSNEFISMECNIHKLELRIVLNLKLYGRVRFTSYYDLFN